MLQSRESQSSPLAPGVLEGVVEPRHFHELDLPIQVPRQPELFEMRDVPQIPEDRAHQRVMLSPEILIRERTQQEEGSLPCLPKLGSDGIAGDRTGNG
jgi:hypothetical protein